MKEHNFERELPNGYRLVKTVDAKSKKLGVIFNVLAILIIVAIIIIAFIPLQIDTQRLETADDVYFMAPLCMILAFAYILLHEIVHGIAYKVQTGEKLTFGLNWSCAFCGVPKIFTYRKTALIAVLAPLVVFTLLFIPLLLIAYFINANVYLLLSIVFAIHLGGSVGDIYAAYLLLVKFKDKKTLVNDTGPKISIFVCGEADEATAQFLTEFNKRDEDIIENEYNGEKVTGTQVAKLFSAISIGLFLIGLIVSCVLILLQNNMLYENPYPLYESVRFNMLIFCIVGIAFSALTIRRFAVIKVLTVIILAFASPILLLVSLLGGNEASYTTDINNYGVYDYPSYMPDYFPAEITEEMTPIKYSYFFDYSWDWCYELYLEVEMTDGEYQSYKSKYENELMECWYSTEHKEYVFSDEPNIDQNEDGSYWVSSPDVQKIIFNDKKNVIVFWALCGIDPLDVEYCYFFERFNVDPKIYKETVEANEEKQ